MKQALFPLTRVDAEGGGDVPKSTVGLASRVLVGEHLARVVPEKYVSSLPGQDGIGLESNLSPLPGKVDHEPRHGQARGGSLKAGDDLDSLAEGCSEVLRTSHRITLV